jgi:hypothetical protein
VRNTVEVTVTDTQDGAPPAGTDGTGRLALDELVAPFDKFELEMKEVDGELLPAGTDNELPPAAGREVESEGISDDEGSAEDELEMKEVDDPAGTDNELPPAAGREVESAGFNDDELNKRSGEDELPNNEEPGGGTDAGSVAD